MTCGAGLYFVAGFATAILLVALQVVGALEARLGWKNYPMLYEVRAEVGLALPSDVVGPARAEAVAQQLEAVRHRMFTAILRVLDAAGQKLRVQERDNVAGLERLSFSVLATRREHQRILSELRASDATDQVVVFRDQEDE